MCTLPISVADVVMVAGSPHDDGPWPDALRQQPQLASCPETSGMNTDLLDLRRELFMPDCILPVQRLCAGFLLAPTVWDCRHSADAGHFFSDWPRQLQQEHRLMQ